MPWHGRLIEVLLAPQGLFILCRVSGAERCPPERCRSGERPKFEPLGLLGPDPGVFESPGFVGQIHVLFFPKFPRRNPTKNMGHKKPF